MERQVQVGVHLIKVIAKPDCPGVSSPGVLHKDGEPYTFIHLVERKNITGGLSTVASNDKATLLEIALRNALDTIAVSDADVFHNVDAIHVEPGYDQGFRSVLLIDFSPLKPEISRLQ